MCMSRILISSATFVICFLAGVPSSSSLSFNFSSFPNDAFGSDILLQGDAEVYRNGGIELTKGSIREANIGSAGRASYKKELFLLWDAQTKKLSDFTTRFVFDIRDPRQTVRGDGLAFFLSAPMYTLPNNSSGRSLGLFTFPPHLPKSPGNSTVAVEFDTYTNSLCNDPEGSHIGIDVNSMNSTATANWSNFKESTIWTSWVTYNSTTYNLSVFLSSGDNKLELSDAVPILNYTIDLSTWLPEKVEIGFSAATGAGIEAHTLLSWSFHSTLQPRKKFKIAVIAISIAGAVVLILVAALGSLWFRKRRRRTNGKDEEADWIMDEAMDNEFERGSGPKRFPYLELARATGDFSDEGKLGEGGFGSVYRGVLKEPKLEVAIKKVSKGSKQGRKEYMSEVKIISRLRHRNLVQLVGWCHDRQELLLVYDLVPNGSLDSHLHGGSSTTLEWGVRLRVTLGLASALLYLQEEWEQCVVHRDIKPSNVMLDSEFNAKLGDFGLARLLCWDTASKNKNFAGEYFAQPQRKSKAELENKLVSVLTKNTFIVLDDVWDSTVWTDFLRKPIVKSASSCTILVTSRKEKVVMQMKPSLVHPVEKMDEESGWNLLKRLAFEGGEDEDEISGLEKIGIELVKKCDGLPIAIKAIGTLLYQQNKAKWEEVLECDAWKMDQIKEELRPLYLSYEDLPSRLKQCFLYCSLYPQKDMYYKEIVQFWVAEGLIVDDQDNPRKDLPTGKQKTVEDLGEEIYRELILRNLLDGDDWFSMHDHFRSLGAHLMREEGILYRHGREFKTDDNIKIRRLSVSNMGPKLVLPPQILKQGCLRTLILMDSPKTKTIEDSVLQALSCLRVLDLTSTSIEKIPDCIGELLHLRYLDLDGTSIHEIPKTIGNLVNLQTLNVSKCPYLERLTESITMLHNLRCLEMRATPLLTYVPKGIGKLGNFYNLQGFRVGQNDSTSDEGCDLEELKNLSKLRGISIYRLERAERGASALADKPFLKELTLGWTHPDEDDEDEEDESEGANEGGADEEADADGNDDDDENGKAEDAGNETEDETDEEEDDDDGDDDEEEEDEEEKGWSEEQISKAERICNEMSQPSSSIVDLLFDGYPGRQFPSWMISSSLAESFPNLANLQLIGLPCCTELPPLGTLPQLKYLSIAGASAITTIGSQFLGSRNSAFPKLEFLQFEDMPKWEEWTFDGVEELTGHGTPLAVKLFPCLRDCFLFDCPKLRALPAGLYRATNLNELCMGQTYELEEIINLPIAYKLEVTNGSGLKKISNISSVRYLEVDNCPNLECVENLGKLQYLVLICSEKMKQLPQWLSGLIEQHNNTSSTHRSFRKFEMQCGLQLLKSCLKGNENWDIIKQIPIVKVTTLSGKEYIRYTKDADMYHTSKGLYQ